MPAAWIPVLSVFTPYAWWFVWISLATFIGSLIALPVLAVRMPADYFVGDGGHDSWAAHHPIVRWTVRIIKNLLGSVIAFMGLVMLFTPGQGILTLLIGLSLLDLPGKRALERRLVSNPTVLDSINAMRRRWGQPPLQME